MREANRKLRYYINRLLPGLFPRLYSTTDNPMVVPVQAAAYRLVAEKYLRSQDSVLDVGFGLGYGLEILSSKAGRLAGIDVDRRAVEQGQILLQRIHHLAEIRQYDGLAIPYPDGAFEVVTCVDVIEHVPDYLSLLKEMARVARRVAVVSTPNRCPENTLPNGRPKNRWHLREWSMPEFNAILRQVPQVRVEWNLINGPWEGPFQITDEITPSTNALTPALIKT